MGLIDPHYTYSIGDAESDHTEGMRESVPDHITVREYAYGWMAEAIAEYEYDNCDGWERSWPQEVRIYKDGEQVAVVDVDYEMNPSFYGEER